MTRSLLLLSIAIVALVAIALAAPEPKHKKFHGGHHHGHAKSRKPRSADPVAYGYDNGDDSYPIDPIDYVPAFNGFQDDDDYYGQFRQYGRGQRVGGRPGYGARNPFVRRPFPAYYQPNDYPQYQGQYQGQYPIDQPYFDDDSDYAVKKERVKKAADKHRVKKDATSLFDKISASIAKVNKQ